MTPRTLNQEIRKGEFFWVADPQHPGRETQVLQARSKVRRGVKLVQVKIGAGWIDSSYVRRAGQRHETPLDHEAPLTWYLNA